MFLLVFIISPVIVFNIFTQASKKISTSKLFIYVLPIMNMGLFVFLLVFSIYGFKKKILALALFLALCIAIFLKKWFKKVVVFQLLMALVTFFMLVPDVYKHLTYNNDWARQPDLIEQVKFKKRPNVYVIQPDGYPNFLELSKGYYQYDNSSFENFLKEKNFKLYQNFRSNYFSTLSSNSSMFAMGHHYYNNTENSINELYNARDFIVGENPVIKIFKNNGYKTNLLLEKSYLLLNRPRIGYDYCNIEPSEISFLAKGFEVNKDVIGDLTKIVNDTDKPNFCFIEKLKPGHINTIKSNSIGRDQERNYYLQNLETSNTWLQKTIEVIQRNDKNAIIIIVADHGGFVGFDYTLECKTKQTDRDLIYSIFSTALAIKWGEGDAPAYDNELKSNVNLFRVLFSYLSENEILLNEMQENKSFAIIEKGAPFGVYEYINEEGVVVFKKYIP